ncbi:DUF2892 domain-containing protein [uncultured Cocleimonas sp.]|uniref:YgaP family membrane protein n=1 Tax=uncultured Cocleimonas sp. TaxID=1051587 RepID=UPI0026257DE7|nr:DUF2892 domain-containing protein [uncultured Cocleimonas sp.]
MNVNVGKYERIIRIVAGLVIIAWGVYAKNWWGAVGAVPLLTGLIGWCPPYAMFGINTCSVKKNKS